MVGIPFKLLDKKIEKKLMFSRRKEIALQLESAKEAQQIFELSVILTVQKTYGVAIVGGRICNRILQQLIDQKKVPFEVSQKFIEVSTSLQNGEPVCEKLLVFIKGCALSKDIIAFGENIAYDD